MEKKARQGQEWAALMRAAQDGDAAAYRRLLDQLAQVIRAIAIRRWGHFDAVEDLVQDVLLSLHSVKHTFDADRPFIPWLQSIIRHRMADMARRQSRRAAHEVTVIELPEISAEVTINYADDGPGDIEELYAAIAALPEGQRQAVEMLRFKEMTAKEAAAATGQSVTALKVAMHRALKSLRSALGKGDG